METSEQQRRPTIGQSAQTLSQLGLDFDAVDLADIFWLAQFMELDRSARLIDPPEPPKTVSTTVAPAVSSNETGVNIYVDDRQNSTASTASSIDEVGPEKPQGVPFPVPAAPALRIRLDLARALRPLMRKVPSQSCYELDEEATVTQFANTQMMMPVVRSRSERWLDLDLVVEDSKTNAIWQRTIAELQHLMEYQGAFRTVRTWRLTAESGDVKLFPRWQGVTQEQPNQRPRSPRELLDPGSRRMILLITDCTSDLWRQGIIHETLWQWAAVQPVSIVQLFPERLWARTALNYGHTVRLGATAPGMPSGRLEIEGLPGLSSGNDLGEDDLDDDPRSLVLPIVPLDPKAMHRWARVISGGGDTVTPGRYFELAVVRQMAIDFEASGGAANLVDSRTARQRVALFKSTASEPAKALAKCMAATPVSLPVIDLLRDEFVPEARQEHVAEVLLSGLLQRIDQTDRDANCRYEFFVDRESPKAPERVRDLLLDDVPIVRTVRLLDRLSQLIKDKAGNTLKSFEAFLAAFDESGEALGSGALPLATVGLEVLQRLGGSQAELAKRYERKWQTSAAGTSRSQIDDFPLEDLEYDVAKFINFPPLQTCEYESATITAILDRFDFETATVARKKRLLRRGDKWEITRRSASSWGYTVEAIGLDMIAIPGGSFVIGAPKSELESSSNERPQQRITLQPFYLGRYAITQAQWRSVAGYDRIDRGLEPDPSPFKGDNLPVENVSWDDAQEFCQRLSVQTGKDYRLPSEAQWEYACRAGTTTPFHFGETITSELASYDGNRVYNDGPKGKGRSQTSKVGSFPANDWGLHDMHGNVWEWCEDDYHDSYEGASIDGSAWVKTDQESSEKLLRGGSWDDYPEICRSACRYNDTRGFRSVSIGFRVSCFSPRVPS